MKEKISRKSAPFDPEGSDPIISTTQGGRSEKVGRFSFAGNAVEV